MLIRLLTHRWLQVVLLLALLTAAVFLRYQNPPAVERLRLMTFDNYNRLAPRPPHDDTLIIDIDEESIAKHGQWPWPRTLVGDLPLILKEMGAKAVVFDMVFSEPDRTSPLNIANFLPETAEAADLADRLKTLPDNDAVFAEKILQAGNVVTGFVSANQPTGHRPILKGKIFSAGKKPDTQKFVTAVSDFTVTLPILTEAAAGNGSFTPLIESDGVVRRIPVIIGQLAGEKGVDGIYPALALEAVRVAEGKRVYNVESYGEVTKEGYGIKSVSIGDYSIPTDEQGALWVYYTGYRPDLYVPAWKVLSRQIDPERVKGKIVFIGTSAIGLLDLRATPFKTDLPGVEIHAEVAEQVLHGQFLKRPRTLDHAEIVATILISLFIIFLAPFIGTGGLALLGSAMIGGGMFGGLYAYKHYGYLVDPVYPSLAIVTIFIVSSILTNLRSEMEKRAVRQAFSHYISPVLMEELANDPEKLKLGGEVRELSIMFTDIRNFTTISQGMDPADLIKMMNDFLTPMTSCVLDNRGTVDKYMGDAMMAFWNAPLDDPDHARHACKSAMEMVKGLAPVNAALKAAAEKSGKPFKELKAGIGINSGMASVGNMGSKQRFAYSALGDAVNLASRVEGQTKGYGVSVMITEATRKGALEYAAIELDLLTVKGRTEPVRVYALLGGPETAQEEDFKAFAALHEQMLTAHRVQEWDKALVLGAECAKLRPDLAGLYNLYEERTATYKNSPPPHDWGGVWVAKEK